MNEKQMSKAPKTAGKERLIFLRASDEIAKMRVSGRIVAEVLAVLKENVKEGISTYDLDKIASDEVTKRGAKASFLGYCGFPATICASINDEVVHGIPSKKRKLVNGDIISIDMGAVYDGYHGDSAVTIAVGNVNAKTAKLLDVTRTSLEKAIAVIKPGARLGDVGHAVQQYAESHGMSVVREYVGHGIGTNMHEEPPVPNYGKPATGLELQAGMVIAVEPMINLGTYQVKTEADGWTVKTVDGQNSAHFEHTIAVTENGCEVLTRI